MSLSTFTLVRAVLSLIGIVCGFVVLFGTLRSRRLLGWTALLLITALLTSVTGFLFLSTSFTPAQGVGVVSLTVLALAVLPLYVYGLAGFSRWVYVIAAVFALNLNVFVGGHTAFPETLVSATISADAFRATIHRLAAYCDGTIDRARHYSREEISPESRVVT